MQPQGLLGQLNQSMSQGVPALGQVSGTSPNFDPSLQVPPPSAMPQGSPMSGIHPALARAAAGGQIAQAPGAQPQPGQQPGQDPSQGQMVTLPIQDQNPQQPGVQVPPTEAELIIKALSTRMGHHNKMEEALMNHATQSSQPQNV